MDKMHLKVSGMKCSSCEVLIERKLKEVPGVRKVRVSRANEEVVIKCDNQIALEELQKAVKEDGYILTNKSESSNNHHKPKSNHSVIRIKRRHAEIGAMFLFIIAIYFVLKQFNLIPEGVGITDNMSYGFIFIIGLVAATSTCLAVAGGLLLAVAAKFNERHKDLTGWQKFKPHIYFNTGRIISYTLLGGVIGALGSVLTISTKTSGFITIIASIIMIIMGLQLLNIFPWLNKLQIKMPKFIAHKIYDSSKKNQGSTSNTSSFLFGGATFFLPCGFTQALQLYVLGKGDFVTGALTMLAFSLGTLPSLAGIGAFSSLTKGNIQKHFMTFSAILVIILGIFNLPNGFALTGADISLTGNDANQLDSGNVKIVDGKQIVEMKVIGIDYYPSKFTIVEGIPVEWRIDGRQAQGCAQVVSAPSIGLLEFLPRNSIKTATFTPQKEGIIRFSCTMGMTTPGASFTVIANTKGIQPANLDGTENVNENSCDSNYPNCEVQKIQMEISNEKGFYPNVFTLKKNVPVEMEIDAKVQLRGCMSTLVIPDYDVVHLMKLGKTTLRFTPTKSGVNIFTCSMGSKLGEFRVN
ncbi:MAG: sulfite exporter TauE/SafE family protein [archaeon]|nr:sulfite exporter TauE/SafE family protein [archaeon]